MEAYRFKTTLTQSGVLTLKNLPFQQGEIIEVIILQAGEPFPTSAYTLRGSVREYLDPTEPVAQDAWECMS